MKKFKVTGSHGLGRQEIEELQSVVDADGLMSAEAVLEKASKKTSALHHRFEWNDGLAAQQYRIDQARVVIGYLTVTLVSSGPPPQTDVSVTVRGRVSLPSDRMQGRGYRGIEVVLNDHERRTELVALAISEFGSLARRWSYLEELQPLLDVVNKFVRKMENIS